MDASMKNSSPMTFNKPVGGRRALAAFALTLLVALSLFAAGCAEKKPDGGPLTETEKAGFKERNARH